MTIFNDQEHSSASTVGAYRPNTLLIRLTTDADMEPSSGEPMPVALATNVHEYIHYLHNFTTLMGVLSFHTTFRLYRIFVEGVGPDGRFSAKRLTPGSLRAINEASATLLNIDGSYDEHKKLVNTLADEVKIQIDAVESLKRPSPKEQSTISVRVTLANKKNSESFGFVVGYTFLTEGIAYCIDREIRRKQGWSPLLLDVNTPAYPYMVYRPLLKFLMGRELLVIEETLIGMIAMMGMPLDEVCYALKEAEDFFVAARELLTGKCLDNFKVARAKLSSFLKLSRNEFKKDDALYFAMDQVMTVLLMAESLRVRELHPEVAFHQIEWEKIDFLKMYGAFLDALVSQEKPDGKAKLYWVGPGKIAKNEKVQQGLATLQSSIYFVRLHIKKDGSVGDTSEVESSNHSCPFMRACIPRMSFKKERADLCSTQPWALYSIMKKAREKPCFYAAGVSVVAGGKRKK